jgi:hypothetical protein
MRPNDSTITGRTKNQSTKRYRVPVANIHPLAGGFEARIEFRDRDDTLEKLMDRDGTP